MPSMDLFERERDAAHNDLRDALAVLSPDQQVRVGDDRRAACDHAPCPNA